MNKNSVLIGVVFGVVFCIISAAFDVFVANITQRLNPAVFIVYCFILSMAFFITLSVVKNRQGYLQKVKTSIPLLLWVNVAVLLNWGGLIISLKYLEPAVVGIASVACGPALTIIISRYFITGASTPTKLESVVAWAVMAGVIAMLLNSYLGKSGVTNTTHLERTIGIICVISSAIGTVLYTFFSKDLSQKRWKSYEILGFRNVLMLFSALVYCSVSQISLWPGTDLFMIVLALSVIGHIIPIFLIQSSISVLDPIHVSLLLLLLPVFTLAFQFIDQRIFISWESITAVVGILILLVVLGASKFQMGNKQEAK
ncbi:EamA family transporter [Musicola paradisiaca]|uniref:EamA domain-containing protein n=1 Tax=Musicola paradisiaca (strain Ech703) TaxID=579405 RepID=C6C7K8_MUSP7|nr:EamA family transporter [Musicola paradisiaca]ACS85950.1 conserved hypothetical protein [Musicola paradisiaca Ech703]